MDVKVGGSYGAEVGPGYMDIPVSGTAGEGGSANVGSGYMDIPVSGTAGEGGSADVGPGYMDIPVSGTAGEGGGADAGETYLTVAVAPDALPGNGAAAADADTYLGVTAADASAQAGGGFIAPGEIKADLRFADDSYLAVAVANSVLPGNGAAVADADTYLGVTPDAPNGAPTTPDSYLAVAVSADVLPDNGAAAADADHYLVAEVCAATEDASAGEFD
jgi:hypothetical protein